MVLNQNGSTGLEGRMTMRKVRFVICPPRPSHVRPRPFESYAHCTKLNHDWRSMASELYALDYIGITHILHEEDELIALFACHGLRVPECIALDPSDPDRIISVEVKRICGNELPLDYTGQTRRKLRSRNQLVWPWNTTIYNSILKAHPLIIERYRIQRHLVVFVIPYSLNERARNRMCERIQSSVQRNFEKAPDALRHMVVYIIQGDDVLFDRF